MDRTYSNHTADAVPAFKIPLTDAQLLALGRLTAIWSQIDFVIDFALEGAFDVSAATRETLIGERMVGAKIVLLERGCEALSAGNLKAKIGTFITLTKAIKNKRNHACHGVWAWRTHPVEAKIKVCARQARDPSTPLKPSELAGLVKAAAACARAGADVLELLNGEPIARPASLLHGKDDVPQAWLGKPEQQPDPSPESLG